MKSLTPPYPPAPTGADKSVVKPSQAFNKQVYRSIGAIILFVITYIFVLLGSVAIAIAFCFLGYFILLAHIGFISLAAGVGIMIAGVLLVYFVIKFLFKKNHTDYSDKIEISEAEQPELFSFIHQLTTEAEAPKPKRIFITADVNAGVFYDSSFWSMFLPVKKNLQIGLGLVNSVNISEFKAVMAHEFGHFSQRSMKFGSYVYNFNKVIYNMLYENEGYDKLLTKWARMHSIFRLMAHLNINIIKGIQSLLKNVYLVVNKTYLGLSREMEFHADAAAAYVSGSNQVVNSLKRIEIGQLCYSSLLDYWNQKLSKNERSLNFYPQQLEIIKYYAVRNDLLQDDYGLPIIDSEKVLADNDQIMIEDQWSSHPSTADRELRLSMLNLNTVTLNDPAWLLFKEPEKLQLRLTDHIYSTANTKPGISVRDFNDFKAEFYGSISQDSFNTEYKDYFDGRNITQFDIDDAIAFSEHAQTITFDQLFSRENCNLQNIIEKMQKNAALLDQVIEVRKDVKTFDYKGIKHDRSDAPKIQSEIEAEVKIKQQEIKDLDQKIFIYFYKAGKSAEIREELVNKYRKLFHYQSDAVQDLDLYNDILIAINPIYTSMTPDRINATLQEVYKKEKKLKPRIQEIIADIETRPHISDEQLKAMEYYVQARLIYYYEPTYDNKSIGEFNKAIDAYISSILKRNFEIKKDLLNFQIGIK